MRTGLRVGAVAAGAGGVLAALGARRPVIRRWPWSLAQVVPCLPASEVPGPLSVLFGAVGAASLLGGGWRSPTGIAAAAVNGVAVAALADLRVDADRSARALDAALDGVAPAPPTGRVTGGRPARARHLRAVDLAYGPDPAQRLDIWGPAEPTANAPVLVQVHGGGWTGGDKRLAAAPLMSYLVERGWVCVTVNYRLAPGSRLPDMIDDVRRALEWTRDNIARYGGDPGFVALTGGSAGGHLASIVGVTSGADVAAVVPVYAVHDFSVDEHGLFALLENTVIGTADHDAWLDMSPLHRVTADAPPFFVVHGSADTMVAVGQSRRFVRRLRELGVEVRHAELPHAQHGFDTFATPRTGHHVRAVHRFLSAVHARHRLSSPARPVPASAQPVPQG